MKLMLATRNPGKISEIKHLLEDLAIELTSLAEHPEILEVVEDGHSFLDNARKKAREAARASGMPAIADDSGLSVAALNGEPGVRSARYAGKQGDYKANNEKLLREMKDVADDKRDAAFICAMVLAMPDGREWDVEESCHGIITHEYRGSGGFGFDPLFYVPEEKATMAELSMERKNAISHRGKALLRMKEILVEILRE